MVRCIHLVTDGDLYNQKAFYTVNEMIFLSSMTEIRSKIL